MKDPARSGMLLLVSASCLMAGLWLGAACCSAHVMEGKDAAGNQQPPPRSALPDQATIQAAVRSVLDEAPAMPRLHEADTLRANQYDKFSRQVEEATVPDCLHADGLKRQPTFFLNGLLALPFIAVAKVRGKCQ